MFGWHAKRKRWHLVRVAFVVQLSVKIYPEFIASELLSVEKVARKYLMGRSEGPITITIYMIQYYSTS